MARQQRTVLSLITRILAFVCAIVGAALAVYCVLLVYAAMTVEYDSLPGSAVLSMIAVGVALVAGLFGGLSHVLWRWSKRQAVATPPLEG